MLRPARAEDLPALAALYAETARRLGPLHYTPAQVDAWAGFGAPTPEFARYVLGADTWIAVGEGAEVLGFSGIDGAGEVHSLYVRHDAVRRGIGSMLLASGLARARARRTERFAAWATPFSLPVFERAGFKLVERVHADFHGALFERLRVRL